MRILMALSLISLAIACAQKDAGKGLVKLSGRAANPDKRQYILTRSGTAGIQRNAATLWSGDIVSRWPDLYNQISAAVSISYSGIPNWTFDIGGFATEARYNARPMKPADQEEWREALFADLAHEAALLPGRRLGSIFFGGGTPSLMEPGTVEAIITAARARWARKDDR